MKAVTLVPWSKAFRFFKIDKQCKKMQTLFLYVSTIYTLSAPAVRTMCQAPSGNVGCLYLLKYVEISRSTFACRSTHPRAVCGYPLQHLLAKLLLFLKYFAHVSLYLRWVESLHLSFFMLLSNSFIRGVPDSRPNTTLKRHTWYCSR